MISYKSLLSCQVWYHMLLIPALMRQRQGDLCEFGANPVYIVSSRSPRGYALSKKNNRTKKQKSVSIVIYAIHTE